MKDNISVEPPTVERTGVDGLPQLTDDGQVAVLLPELSCVKNIYDNFERNPYLQNMNPNIRVPYCKPYYTDKEPNNLGYPVSLTNLGYNTQKNI